MYPESFLPQYQSIIDTVLLDVCVENWRKNAASIRHVVFVERELVSLVYTWCMDGRLQQHAFVHAVEAAAAAVRLVNSVQIVHTLYNQFLPHMYCLM